MASESEVNAKDRLHHYLLTARLAIDGRPDPKATDKALAQLQADILAIIGEDEPAPMVGYDHGWYPDEDATSRNELRAELRQALDSYFKGGE